MSAAVVALAAAGGQEPVELIVRYDEHPELFDDQRIAALGGTVVREYNVLDMRAIRLPAETLIELALEDNVDRLSLDEGVSASSVAARTTANLPAAASANAAFDGAGVGIAVLDSGIAAHADLPGQVRQYNFLHGNVPHPTVVDGEITAYNDEPRSDLYGHGTHVAAIIAGQGTASNGQYRGAANGVALLSLRVLDEHGNGQMSDVMAALDWLLVYGDHFDVRVANLSLGKPISESNTTDPLVHAVEALWDSGVVTVVAAGNLGARGNRTVKSPGNSRKVITVGSLTDRDTGLDFTDDIVSTFSSRGPTAGDLVLKPDLVAPGNRIVAAIPTGSQLVAELPTRLVACSTLPCSDHYLSMSGTSMATPLVAATAALMLDKDPSLSPATVKARLMQSARKIDGQCRGGRRRRARRRRGARRDRHRRGRGPLAAADGQRDGPNRDREHGRRCGAATCGPRATCGPTATSGPTARARSRQTDIFGPTVTCGRTVTSGPTATSGPTVTSGPTATSGRTVIFGPTATCGRIRSALSATTSKRHP